MRLASEYDHCWKLAVSFRWDQESGRPGWLNGYRMSVDLTQKSPGVDSACVALAGAYGVDRDR